jgi:hypothetical protein
MEYPYTKALKANQEAVEGYLKDMEITKFFDDTPFNKDEVTKPFKLPENPCHDCELTFKSAQFEAKYLDIKAFKYSSSIQKGRDTIALKNDEIFKSFWAGGLLLQDSITVKLSKGSGRSAFSMEKTFHFTIRATKKNGELYTQEEHKKYLDIKKEMTDESYVYPGFFGIKNHNGENFSVDLPETSSIQSNDLAVTIKWLNKNIDIHAYAKSSEAIITQNIKSTIIFGDLSFEADVNVKVNNKFVSSSSNYEKAFKDNYDNIYDKNQKFPKYHYPNFGSKPSSSTELVYLHSTFIKTSNTKTIDITNQKEEISPLIRWVGISTKYYNSDNKEEDKPDIIKGCSFTLLAGEKVKIDVKQAPLSGYVAFRFEPVMEVGEGENLFRRRDGNKFVYKIEVYNTTEED